MGRSGTTTGTTEQNLKPARKANGFAEISLTDELICVPKVSLERNLTVTPAALCRGMRLWD
jgi:hypothetical protein